MAGKRTYTVRDIPEDEMTKARLLLEWSRSLEEHGLQFEKWCDHYNKNFEIIFTDVSSS